MSKGPSIWIFRHAQRDHAAPDQKDPGLSRDGKIQAQSIADYFSFLQQQEKRLFQFYASPKKRSQETLRPAAEKLHVSLVTDALLDERYERESSLIFRQRVEKWVEKSPPLLEKGADLVVCSHLDWLEEVLSLIPASEDLTADRFQHWPTGHFVRFSPPLPSKQKEVWHFEEWRSLP